MDKGRELPSLESVNSGGEMPFLGMMALVLMFLSAIPAIVMLSLMLFSSSSDQLRFGLNTETAIIIGCATICLILFVALRTPTSHYEWKTTTEGLRFRGSISGGLIRWNEVVSVETRWVNILTGRRAVVATHNHVTYVPVQDPVLAASVWQHLNRIGKAEGIDLSSEADSLWTEDLNRVPESIEWNHPKPARFGTLLAWATAFVALGYGIESLLISHRFAGWLLALPALTMAERALGGLHGANRICIDGQGITARTMFRSISVRWNEIRSAKWQHGLHSSLEIRAGLLRLFCVPYLEDDQSRQLILSLILHLRDRANLPLPLPEDFVPEPEEE